VHRRDIKLFCVFSAIGTVAILPLLVLPAMVGVLVDESAISESFAGWSASVNFFGGASSPSPWPCACTAWICAESRRSRLRSRLLPTSLRRSL
jgi:hypothetical protein